MTCRPPAPVVETVTTPVGFDLARDYGLLRGLYFGRHPGHAARVRAAGLDVDDVLQAVCLSLLRSAPWDPARGWSLQSWLGAILRRTVGHALDSQRRRLLREELGEEGDAGEEGGGVAVPLEDLLDLLREGSGEEDGGKMQKCADVARPPDRYPPVVTQHHTTPLLDLSPSSAGLSPLQGRAALLLATGKSLKEVAAEVGAGLRTVSSWRADERFARFVSVTQDRLFHLEAARLTGHTQPTRTRKRAAS